MNIVASEAELTRLAADRAGITSTSGTTNEYAFVEVRSATHPDRLAVVKSPGDGWFSISVDSRYVNLAFDEVENDVEAQRLLERYVNAAAAYVQGRSVRIRGGLFGSEAIRVDSEGGPIDLTLTVGDAVRDLFRRAFRRERREGTKRIR